MTNGFITKIAIEAALLLLTIITGVLLHKAGKPYSNGVLTIHKLATLAFIAVYVSLIIHYSKSIGIEGITLAIIAVGASSLLGLLISGGALTLDKYPELMLIVHRTLSVLFVLCAGGLFYIIIRG